ncbi:MAG: hypothetical protein ACK5VB_04885 [Bacteroidota bacterium]
MKKQQLFTFLMKYLLISGLFLLQNDSMAQSATILFQGILKTASGAPVPDGNYTFTFTLWSSLNGTANTDKLLIAGATDYNIGANQWSETVTLKVMGGIYSHQLGSVTPLNPRNFQALVYLNISVGGRDLVPRSGLVYSPYAFFVSTAYQAVCSGAVGDIKYSLLPPDKFKDVNGDCWVPLDGRTLASGDALSGYGVASLPVVGGTFIRAQDFTGDSNIERNWSSVTYGNGLYVAVANSGTGNRVMTSPDGINWTSRTSASDNNWNSVTYGNGLFVAVADGGPASANHVMTSPDGINWTSRSASSINWKSVTYGNGLFVAVSSTTTTARVMTSSDGITWTNRTTSSNINWSGVAYGNGQFVAVAPNSVMTSPDGITWTARSAAAASDWKSITYGNGLYVAVANNGTGNRVMTSPDGITWTGRTASAANSWTGITYVNGLFVAVANSGSGNRVMTSPDGITWTSRNAASENSWSGVTNGNGLFVAVAGSGMGNRVMTSSNGINWTTSKSPTDYWKSQNSSDADPGRTSSTAPGTLQTSDFKAHTHTMTNTDGSHSHTLDRRARESFNGNGNVGDNSVEAPSNPDVSSSTSSTDGDHTHTMNAS